MKQPHNPTSGFHDIKILPDAVPTESLLSPLTLSLLAALILIIVTLFLLRISAKRKIASKPALAPLEECRLALNHIRRSTTPSQNSLVEISMALRKYLQRSLSGNHLSLTTSEVALVINGRGVGSLLAKLPLTPKTKLNNFSERLLALLKELDSLAFSPPDEHQGQLIESIGKAVDSAEELAESLEVLIRSEEEKNISATQASSANLQTNKT